MSNIETPTDWVVRVPWPDEFRRIHEHFNLPVEMQSTRELWAWVLVTGEEERIVGVGWLGWIGTGGAKDDPLTTIGRYHFNIRARWVRREVVAAFHGAMIHRARGLGLNRVQTQMDPEHPLVGQIEGLGWKYSKLQELWRIPLQEAIQRRRPLVDRIARRYPVAVHPIDDRSIARVREICLATRLLSEQRVWREIVPGDGGFDPEMSFIAGDPERPVAVALARMVAHDAYLEVLARTPDAKTAAPAAPGVLLRAVAERAHEMGAQALYCAVEPDSNAPIRRLLERAGGRRMSRHGAYILRDIQCVNEPSVA